MPTYTWECKDCGQHHEVFRDVRRYQEPSACPHCGQADTRRVLDATGVTVVVLPDFMRHGNIRYADGSGFALKRRQRVRSVPHRPEG